MQFLNPNQRFHSTQTLFHMATYGTMNQHTKTLGFRIWALELDCPSWNLHSSTY